MTEIPHPTASWLGGPFAQGAALRGLSRSVLASRFGVRLARGIGIAQALWFSAGALVAARDASGDGWTAGIAARGAATIAGYAGAVVAFSLAGAAKSADPQEGARHLATARGFSSRDLAIAETSASVRLASEAIAFPTLALALFCAVASRSPEVASLLPFLGIAIFGGVASVVLGGLASICRQWGGARARTALLAIVVLPWIVGEALLEGRGSEYVSIPGLLAWMWRLLIGASG